MAPAAGVLAAIVVCCVLPAVAGCSRRASSEASPGATTWTASHTREGIGVTLALQAPARSDARAARLQDGDPVTVRLAVTASGQPLAGGGLAAWMDLRPGAGATDETTCTAKVAKYLTGNVLQPPLVDLNVFYVLALNEDGTISVVDPQFGFGGSRLLTLIGLKSPGMDWVLAPRGDRLFVSMPASNQVAVIDTTTWKVLAEVDAGAHPSRIALQPDGQYLWVSFGEDAGDPESGVVAIDTTTLSPAARISLGAGRHELAFDPDQNAVFVTSSAGGAVTIIDVARLAASATLPTGDRPVSIAWSPLAKMAYVAHEGDGAIAVVDARTRSVVAHFAAEPGVAQIRFAPQGRFGFLANPARSRVQIIDAAKNQVMQSAEIPGGPDQITFSRTLAYVRSRDSDTVQMIPLDKIGGAGQSVPAADFPGGQHALGRFSLPSRADSLVSAPDEGEVLVANPADRAIYFYKEGMAAPMGSFSNYSREPRAVLVVDRSLREVAPGVQETSTRLRSAGHYDLIVLLDSPRYTHCFPFEVAPSADAPQKTALRVESLWKQEAVRAGHPLRFQFKLSDAVTRAPRAKLDDVRVLASAPGNWQKRLAATEVGDGVYESEIAFPEPGAYYLFVQSMSAGLAPGSGALLTLQVGEPEAAPGQNDTKPPEPRDRDHAKGR